ncbi:hypothetical protein IW261DRAFT_894711 [Armillaria novae-zelandiae]|uniref:Uncharacterized protein n=1 Tax=Armillaria novae-zelandiae TaxID=153914 RepID=A0AA39NTP9_9AGAR|nr:hypothetical protein IW261DRAFT_894711 [Armillaria novae-zelandiae]
MTACCLKRTASCRVTRPSEIIMAHILFIDPPFDHPENQSGLSIPGTLYISTTPFMLSGIPVGYPATLLRSTTMQNGHPRQPRNPSIQAPPRQPFPHPTPRSPNHNLHPPQFWRQAPQHHPHRSLYRGEPRPLNPHPHRPPPPFHLPHPNPPFHTLPQGTPHGIHARGPRPPPPPPRHQMPMRQPTLPVRPARLPGPPQRRAPHPHPVHRLPGRA